MSNSSFHVAIIGGGIGGLCLAQGLKKSGVSVAVYERDRTRTDRLQGYRIHISPKGSRALYECLPSDLYEAFVSTCSRSNDRFTFLTEQMDGVKSRCSARSATMKWKWSDTALPRFAGRWRRSSRRLQIAESDSLFGRRCSSS